MVPITHRRPCFSGECSYRIKYLQNPSMFCLGNLRFLSGFPLDLTAMRNELAEALRAPDLDKAALDRVFEKHDELIERLRASFLRAADQVHATLDERQRQQLADLIEGGPWKVAGC